MSKTIGKNADSRNRYNAKKTNTPKKTNFDISEDKNFRFVINMCGALKIYLLSIQKIYLYGLN